MPQSRRLAAIMFTDIVGYTALMGEDEQKAFDLLKKNRQIQRPIIEKFNGKWLKEIGDGVLASFSTVSDAVYCARELQETCLNEPDLKLRIGIHQGEVVFEGNDVFGDGVNIASRLEPLAPVGGILVSESVNQNINNKPDINTVFQREEYLKGVKDPVKTYQILIDGLESTIGKSKSKTPATEISSSVIIKMLLGIAAVLGLIAILFFVFDSTDSSEGSAKITPSEKSIAVLPFRDISPNKDQEWFGDGMMEAVLDHLVKIPGLKVTSRTSVMQYKQTLKTVPDIAKELGVNYLLEGGVQVVGDDVRITAQLIDVNDQHLWSEQFDRPYKDVFAIQTEIAERIAATMQATIADEVKERINRVPTDNLEAYKSYLLAQEKIREGSDQAWGLFEKAIELDPEFSEAYAYYGALWYFVNTWTGHEDYTNQEIVNKSHELLKKALALDSNNAFAHYQLGQVYCYALLELRKADEEFKIAQRLNPSNIDFVNPEFLTAIGRFKAGLQADIALFKAKSRSIGNYPISLYLNGRMNEAQKLAEHLEDSIGNGNTGYSLNRVALWSKNFEIVIRQHERQPNNYTRIMTNVTIAQYHLGQQNKVDAFIEHLKSITNGVGSPAYCLGLIYAQMGDTEEAIKWLGQAWEERQGELYWLKHEPTWEPIRDDPRFQELVEKIGYPQAE